MERAAGFVLVGGRSSRMRQDKAKLRVGDYYLVELVAQAVAQAAGSVTLVGNPASFADVPFDCLTDLHPRCGPLAGIEAALASERAEFNLIVGCDMPNIPVAELVRLLEAARQSASLCTIALDTDGRRHPLCAVYRQGALPLVRAALASGRLRLLDFVEELKAGEVRIDSTLSNLNTPEQWAAWQAAQLV